MKNKFMKVAFATLCLLGIQVVFGVSQIMAEDIVLMPITPPINGEDGTPPHRDPIIVPVFYLDGYTLTASDNTIGSTVELLDEDDNVVFSTYVYIEGDIQLPTTLAGTYTIEVTRAGQTFIGEIEL